MTSVHPKLGSPAALHSKKTPKWGTPEEISIRSRLALGGVIHLDPASSPEFNARVGALRILTETDNGLTADWVVEPELYGLDLWPIEGISLFLNPPGGLVRQFWDRLLEHYEAGAIRNAVWIGFSVEQLCTLQDSKFYPLDFSTVIPRKRLAFTQESGESGGSPSHGNYITGIGIDREIFSSVFGDLGRIVHGSQAKP